jgi:hypothetical protein
MTTTETIEDRNRRVGLDKAWETSKTRRFCIASVTYAIATLFMWRIGVTEPYINAFVPTGGYLLSTLSLPFIKKRWLKKYGAK